MRASRWIGPALVGLGMMVGGCADNADQAASDTAATPASSQPTSSQPAAAGAYVAAERPEGAVGVLEAKKGTGAGEVTVVGRIGGDREPFVDGMAAFTIVDPSLRACSDIEGDACKTPWDYCCEPDVAAGRALVKVVDDGGTVVGTDARQLLGVKELATVVVRGKAERDDAGNLTVLADKVYVQP